MPVKSSDSSVLVWPKKSEVIRACSNGRKVCASHAPTSYVWDITAPSPVTTGESEATSISS
jgi:hypothetical protein